MAVQATCVSVTKLQDGRVQVQWDGGEGSIFSSIQEMMDFALLDETRERAQKLLLSWWLARSPDAANENLVEGKTITIDLSAANAVRIQ